ncbi:MAG: NAD(P)H-dependent oxidoreductase [Flavobacteriaceae bacterium]|jgi:nitroreductase / dihydropteridine reductase|nr:NAD(P)H-dependent oxidoreductase [Flavobacteriaceae bacterium]
MSLLDALKWRYATKKFDTNKAISSSDLEKIKEGFNLSASSYGLQPVELLLVHNKAIQKELVPMAMNQLQVEQASHVAIFCVKTALDANYVVDYFERIKAIRETPDEILAPFRTHIIESFSTKTPEEVQLWGAKQAYLAMGNLLVVCADLKIDACPMEGFEPQKIDDYFDLKAKGLKSVLLMPMGYRAEDDPFATMKKVRKALSESVTEIS